MSSEPRHLHPAAMIIAAIRTIRRSLSAFVIPGIAFLMSRGLDPGTIALVLLGALVVAVLAAFWGFLSWRATTYEVAGGAFRLRQGIVQKNERTIPLDHVQSVDTVQGLIQRLFDVVEVRIETAGGGASEPDASLAALGRPEAQALRREIEGSRREPDEAEEAPEPAIIRKLGTRELLVAGATSGQIGVALSLLVVASQLFDEVLSEDIARRLLETFAPRSVTIALLYVFILGLFAWLLAIGGTVLAHAGFTLSRDGEFLYIRRGLLERREATIPLARIQAIRVSEGLLRQPFGLASLRVESAGYGEDAGVSTVLYPLLPRREVREFLQVAAPEFAVDPPLDVLPRRALRRYVFRSTVPVLVLLVAAGLFSLLVFEFALWSLAAMLLLLPAALYGWLRYRDAGWALEDDRLVVRSRLLGRSTTIAPRRRLQSRATVRSPLQRRARLATFRARVASGGGGAELQITDLGSEAAEGLIERLRPRLQRSGQ
jgi:putative membrane protein